MLRSIYASRKIDDKEIMGKRQNRAFFKSMVWGMKLFCRLWLLLLSQITIGSFSIIEIEP